MLTIVPTPIGNLKDITLRSLETLNVVDGIICEDTRKTLILLNHFQIKKPLIVLNDYDESKMVPVIIEKLISGQNLALVSDAGTPLISDPGYKLIRECLAKKIEVDSLPGPSSVITALTLSGLPPDKFLFLGYLPDKPGHRQTTYQNIKSLSKIIPMTFILFIAPFKLIKSLKEMRESLGEINISFAHELTKIHQSINSDNISDWIEKFKNQSPKGEWVMLFRIDHTN